MFVFPIVEKPNKRTPHIAFLLLLTVINRHSPECRIVKHLMGHFPPLFDYRPIGKYLTKGKKYALDIYQNKRKVTFWT